MFEKVVVVDARAHMMGRLASVVAKELLNGQHVVLVRCEGINISGSRKLLGHLSVIPQRVRVAAPLEWLVRQAFLQRKWNILLCCLIAVSSRWSFALSKAKLLSGRRCWWRHLRFRCMQ